MKIANDPASQTPIFEQIRRQIVEQVRSGELAVGTKLPTVRGLAGELGLAVNTVAKAYRVLEEDGVIETRGRQGSFVSVGADDGRRRLLKAAQRFAEEARKTGTPGDEALKIAASALDNIK
ncbi:GntR family transcriptional regulator [Saxibacter everestensis]|uniref:GntR family transcriptional regulator n=1 Tax=Saxibacter everestensis TaxID=2909229 RepID=A0ABY8QQB6_9MICO|nr:GntR family transcriptional regulator [Brevibacteriaceae bacterium ZFBP1038]